MDVNTGDIAWQVPYGAMNGVPAGITTGAPSSRGGPTTTAGGLIFMTGTLDQYFRALETKDRQGAVVLQDGPGSLSSAHRYAGKSGKEYVAIAAGENLIAFTLSEQRGCHQPGYPAVQTQLPEGGQGTGAEGL